MQDKRGDEMRYYLLKKWLDIPTYKRREIVEDIYMYGTLGFIFIIAMSGGYLVMEFTK